MGSVKIKLKFNDLEEFTNRLRYMSGSWELRQDRYIVNARSIMGICSLDLERPMKLCTDRFTDDELAAAFSSCRVVDDEVRRTRLKPVPKVVLFGDPLVAAVTADAGAKKGEKE